MLRALLLKWFLHSGTAGTDFIFFRLEEIFMLPAVSPDSHKDFHVSFVQLFLLHCPDPFALSRQTWQAIVQFWNMDLSQTDVIPADAYSKYGLRCAGLPACSALICCP